MDLRVQLIQDYDEGESISALAEIYGVSRKTIYKWLERHEAEGVAGLPTAAARRNIRRQAQRRGDRQIIAARQRWNWGPRKLRVKLAAAHPTSPGPRKAPSAKC